MQPALAAISPIFYPVLILLPAFIVSAIMVFLVHTLFNKVQFATLKWIGGLSVLGMGVGGLVTFATMGWTLPIASTFSAVALAFLPGIGIGLGAGVALGALIGRRVKQTQDVQALNSGLGRRDHKDSDSLQSGGAHRPPADVSDSKHAGAFNVVTADSIAP